MIILLGLALAGCTAVGPERACDEIGVPSIRHLMGSPVPVEQLQEQIASTYHIPADAISKDKVEALSTSVPWTNANRRVGDTWLSWRKDGVAYGLLVRDQALDYLYLRFEQRPPSAEQAIQCFGKPDGYWAYFYPGNPTRRLTSLHLFYKTLGITVWADQYRSDARPSQFDDNTPIGELVFVPPSPATDVMHRMLDPTESALVDQVENQVRPWPERWQDIIVETPSSQ
jgi:hypothetical protein